MIDNVPAVVPPTVAAETVTPSPVLPPPGESSMPPPTAEQAQAADHVFTAPTHPHPVATLLGVVTSAMLLRDLAVDTFDTTGEEEELEEEPSKDADSTD